MTNRTAPASSVLASTLLLAVVGLLLLASLAAPAPRAEAPFTGQQGAAPAQETPDPTETPTPGGTATETATPEGTGTPDATATPGQDTPTPQSSPTPTPDPIFLPQVISGSARHVSVPTATPPPTD